jgi:hypothetical protein
MPTRFPSLSIIANTVKAGTIDVGVAVDANQVLSEAPLPDRRPKRIPMAR